MGYSHFTNNKMRSWKYYSGGGQRITLTAVFNYKKVLIKIGTDSESYGKIENSIKALKLVDGKFDFVPNEEPILYNNRICYKTDYIDCYSFYEMTYYIKKHLKEYVK